MVKFLIRILTVLCVLFCASARAQFVLPVVHTFKNGSVQLQDLKVNVDVVGNVATTTFDMTFHNSSSRVLEGEFEFPLGDGQTVSRYALDINGKLREGVVVEKEKGRKVFEEVVRNNVDPGLIEKTKGNNFKTRIYPFNPEGTRRVVVAYEQELKTTNGKRYYRLPLVSDVKLRNFSLDVNLQGQALPLAGKDAMPLNFSKKGSNYTAAFQKTDCVIKNDIVIEIPNRTMPSVYTQNVGTQTYFYAFANLTPQHRDKVMPKSLTVVYDVSASAENANQAAARDLLKSYFAKCGVKTVRLVTFSYMVHTDVTCSVESALSQLENVAFDGATQLGCLDFGKYSSDEILLITDGIGNIGKDEPVAGKKPVQVINASKVADHPFLRKIATMNHGNYVDLSATEMSDALNMLSVTTYNYIGAKFDGKQIMDVYPSLPCPVGETFSVTGMMLPKTANMTLYFGFGNTVTDSITYEVSALAKQEANNVKRIWAQKKIAELEMDKKRNEDEITKTAKNFGIVTDNTSLIVLDRVEDYVRYGIVPPAELQDQYNILVRNQPTTDNESTLSESIIREREKFVKWWNTKFDINAKPNLEIEKYETYRRQVSRRDSPNREYRISAEESNTFFDDVPPVTQEVEVEAEFAEIVELRTRTSSSEPHTIETPTSKINIQYWNPGLPYLAELKSTPANEMYAHYLKLKKQNASSPAFYMDVADYFYRENQVENAIRIVSNLCELKLEDAEIARSCAKKLEEYKSYALAVSVFEQVVKMRGEEPQAYRDLALACAENAEYQRAADLLYKVSSRLWNNRFKNVQQIAINELNALIALNKGKIDTNSYDQRLMGNCPVDVRISLSWNTDNADIDLWVTDPNGEKVYYKHKESVIGGRISDDVTQGFGPEEFCLKVAKPGKYKIEANYYGSSSQKVLQPVVVTATVFTNFGKPNQKKEVLTLQLNNIKGTYLVGEITFGK